MDQPWEIFPVGEVFLSQLTDTYTIRLFNGRSFKITGQLAQKLYDEQQERSITVDGYISSGEIDVIDGTVENNSSSGPKELT